MRLYFVTACSRWLKLVPPHFDGPSSLIVLVRKGFLDCTKLHLSRLSQSCYHSLKRKPKLVNSLVKLHKTITFLCFVFIVVALSVIIDNEFLKFKYLFS